MRVAIVTGASRGIGRAVAERLAGAGIGVALVAETEERVQEAAVTHLSRVMDAEAKPYGVRVFAIEPASCAPT